MLLPKPETDRAGRRTMDEHSSSLTPSAPTDFLIHSSSNSMGNIVHRGWDFIAAQARTNNATATPTTRTNASTLPHRHDLHALARVPDTLQRNQRGQPCVPRTWYTPCYSRQQLTHTLHTCAHRRALTRPRTHAHNAHTYTPRRAPCRARTRPRRADASPPCTPWTPWLIAIKV